MGGVGLLLMTVGKPS